MQPFVISTSFSSVWLRSAPTGPHEVGVDVHLGHVVDDDRDAPAFSVGQDAVQEGGLAGAEEAREDSNGKAAGGSGGLDHGIALTILHGRSAQPDRPGG
jgi:hypothetical protein